MSVADNKWNDKECNGLMHSLSSYLYNSLIIFMQIPKNTDKHIPHVTGLPDQVASLWQTLSLTVVFTSRPSQMKQALEPGVVPL